MNLLFRRLKATIITTKTTSSARIRPYAACTAQSHAPALEILLVVLPTALHSAHSALTDKTKTDSDGVPVVGKKRNHRMLCQGKSDEDIFKTDMVLS